MIEITLIVTIENEAWSKKAVIFRPHKGETIEDHGLRFRVIDIEHSTSGIPDIIATLEGEVKGNSHWELGHERGWTLKSNE